MKVLSAAQIREWDAYTIHQEPISSIDLMERASLVFTEWFMEKFRAQRPVKIICGPGNNGGDGLAVARLLEMQHYEVEVYVFLFSKNTSQDFNINLKRLPRHGTVSVRYITEDQFYEFQEGDIIIDALLGSGLTRPVEGFLANYIEFLNEQPSTKVSIDIPSGLFADQASEGIIFRADYTLTFELPKLAFFFPENHPYIGNWEFRSIQLHPDFYYKTNSNNFYIDNNFIKNIYKTKNKFDHKGTNGHALMIGGQYGSIGAILMATQAAIRAGAGLCTTHAPGCANHILQTACPEAMFIADENENNISNINFNLNTKKYTAIGIGCGMGMKESSAIFLKQLLKTQPENLVVDADGLNILAANPAMLNDLPANTILTPHPKEFERLFGPAKNSFDRLVLLKEKAKHYNIIIILKGAHTCIATPDGNAYFNSTGNPGMATGGSGDVLTGIITGLLAQKYSAVESAILGVYLHGLSGDLALESESYESLKASDLIHYLGKAFKTLIF